MGAGLELIRETKPKRHTGSKIYQVAAGRGWSEIGGQRFEWEEKDIFCVPSWTPYRHGAHGEAVLFHFNDLPAMKALALYREETAS
jgi:gentisate 1,2-dioxygenase